MNRNSNNKQRDKLIIAESDIKKIRIKIKKYETLPKKEKIWSTLKEEHYTW